MQFTKPHQEILKTTFINKTRKFQVKHILLKRGWRMAKYFFLNKLNVEIYSYSILWFLKKKKTSIFLLLCWQICIIFTTKICRFKAGNWCYYSAQKLLSSRFLFKNLKITVYNTILLPGILFDCKIWSLELWGEHRQRLF